MANLWRFRILTLCPGFKKKHFQRITINDQLYRWKWTPENNRSNTILIFHSIRISFVFFCAFSRIFVFQFKPWFLVKHHKYSTLYKSKSNLGCWWLWHEWIFEVSDELFWFLDYHFNIRERLNSLHCRIVQDWKCVIQRKVVITFYVQVSPFSGRLRNLLYRRHQTSRNLDPKSRDTNAFLQMFSPLLDHHDHSASLSWLNFHRQYQRKDNEWTVIRGYDNANSFAMYIYILLSH